jgi:hypothetical protein
MRAMCCASRPSESPNPGVSITIIGSSPCMPRHLANTPVTPLVSDFKPDDVLNALWPTSEFASEDLPWPLTPIATETRIFSDISSLPAEVAASKTFSRSPGGTSIILLSFLF